MKTWVVGAHGGSPCLGAHVACCLMGAQPGLRVGSTPRTPEVWVVVGGVHPLSRSRRSFSSSCHPECTVEAADFKN